jgi:hypothetical protein
MSEMDKWLLVKSQKDAGHGIYQEKLIIICPDIENRQALQDLIMKTYPDVEWCNPPRDIMASHPFAFAIWTNKHSTTCSDKDLRDGNIRKKIE